MSRKRQPGPFNYFNEPSKGGALEKAAKAARAASKRAQPKKQTAGKAGRKAGTFKPGPDPRRNLTKPGPGRPRGVIRDIAAKSVEDRIDAMCEIVDNGFKDSDRVAAFNALAKLSGIELTKIVGDEEATPVQSVLRFSDGQEIVF